MTYYKILLDEQKFDEFVNFLPDLEENEVYYVALFGRHKYCNTLPNLRDNQLVRFTSSKEDLKEKVLRLECPIGGYKRDGVDVPQEALALYITLNPRNLVKANKELLVELAKCCAEGKFDFNPLSLARTAVHRAVHRKIFVDFDYDNVEPQTYLSKINEVLPTNSYKILQTRGGFHLLILLERMKEVKINWFKSLSSLEGCDVKGSNTIVPVAGCSQGGFIPSLMNINMIHALDNYKALGERAFAANLWIDGTSPDDTYQGDATQGPWVVFDITAQKNIAGPFNCDQDARDALLTILEQRK